MNSNPHESNHVPQLIIYNQIIRYQKPKNSEYKLTRSPSTESMPLSPPNAHSQLVTTCGGNCTLMMKSLSMHNNNEQINNTANMNLQLPLFQYTN